MPRILVVDDDLDLLEVLQLTLESAGHDVHLAHDGQSALAEALEIVPELIILDIMMKTDTDGLETAHAIRTHSDYEKISTIPIVMLTNIERMQPFQTQSGETIETIDVQAFLRKPIEPRNFLTLIKSILD